MRCTSTKGNEFRARLTAFASQEVTRWHANFAQRGSHGPGSGEPGSGHEIYPLVMADIAIENGHL